jgi:glucose/arabinose dehydrogenase
MSRAPHSRLSLAAVVWALLFIQPLAVSSAQGRPEPWPKVALSDRISGFNLPVDLVNAGDGSQRLFVAELGGLIRIVRGGSILSTPFLDLSDMVTCAGLFGVAFSPDFETDGTFYVAHMIGACDLSIARYRIGSDGNVADPASREEILRVPISDPSEYAHAGGKIIFGPDSYLYIAIGDGRFWDPPEISGQDPSSLLGKILRIDVQTGDPATYTIPPKNPFVGQSGVRPEIWAMGLRNPWRMSFDSLNGDLFIGDVGQNSFEEINHQDGSSLGGQNYGWPIMEAGSCYQGTLCDRTGLTLPVAQFTHSDGCVATAGEMSRAQQSPGLNGIFFYADFCTGKLWGLTRSGTWEGSLLLETGLTIVSFGQDEDQNIWLADHFGGAIHRLAQDCGAMACDHDGDTLPDATDGCPAVSGPPSRDGCPVPESGGGIPDLKGGR